MPDHSFREGIYLPDGPTSRSEPYADIAAVLFSGDSRRRREEGAWAGWVVVGASKLEFELVPGDPRGCSTTDEHYCGPDDKASKNIDPDEMNHVFPKAS